jgi:tRNA(His) 5'-end guanylyltransferase
MRFDELDKKMRVYETAHDYCVPPGNYIVARLDGRNFTRLTRDILKLTESHNEKFSESMLCTVMHLMNCGFNIVHGYTQSDEISLLFDIEDTTFNRKLRKLCSILAGEASAVFSLDIGKIASFDCRISILPDIDYVLEYFMWRMADAKRNSLNSMAYWVLCNNGYSARSATSELKNKSVKDKYFILLKYGIDFDSVDAWKKVGVGVYWQEYEKSSVDRKTLEHVISLRRTLKINSILPMDETDYKILLDDIINTPQR